MFSRAKSRMSIQTLLSFSKKFNNWVAEKSEKAGMLDITVNRKLPLIDRVRPIYPIIRVSKWLALSDIDAIITPNSKIIGFISNNLNYYTTTTSLKTVSYMKVNNVLPVLYDPDLINLQIYAKRKVVLDKRCYKIGRSMYENNLYQLLLLEFLHIFDTQKNTGTRKKINKIIASNLNSDFDDIMKNISDIVKNCDDYSKIKNLICEFVNKHHKKKILFEELKETSFAFDRGLFEQIKKLPVGKLYQRLLKISERFVSHGNIKNLSDFDFPNMFISCQSKGNHGYCNKNKFIIDKKKLEKLLRIMAADMLNPIKSKWLFSGLMSNNVVSYFKFNRAPHETIYISQKN